MQADKSSSLWQSIPLLAYIPIAPRFSHATILRRLHSKGQGAAMVQHNERVARVDATSQGAATGQRA